MSFNSSYSQVTIILIYPSTEFFIFGTVLAEILLVAVMFVPYLTTAALFVALAFHFFSFLDLFSYFFPIYFPSFPGFLWKEAFSTEYYHECLRGMGIFNCPLCHEGAQMKTHVQMTLTLLIFLCFLISRCI